MDRSCTPETAAQVSAVALLLCAAGACKSRYLTSSPIGLVVDAVGGTPAETWTSVAALRQVGGLDVPLAELQRALPTAKPDLNTETT